MLQPMLIVALIGYFNDNSDFKTALIYCTIISLSITFMSLSHHVKFFGLQTEGMKIRLSCMGLVYKKVFFNKFIFQLLKQK
jgi:hypothetical protein